MWWTTLSSGQSSRAGEHMVNHARSYESITSASTDAS